MYGLFFYVIFGTRSGAAANFAATLRILLPVEAVIAFMGIAHSVRHIKRLNAEDSIVNITDVFVFLLETS
jgi:hypothetical protein